MTKSVRESFCKRVTTSEAGDCFQVLFEGIPDSDERYVLVQRQFESPDGGNAASRPTARTSVDILGSESRSYRGVDSMKAILAVRRSLKPLGRKVSHPDKWP